MSPFPTHAQGAASPLTIQELSDLTGFEPRTIRHYIERGLLPGSHGRGRGAGYGPEHLDRLRFIEAVRKRARLSLSELADLMGSLETEQIQRIGRGEEEVRAMLMSAAPEWEPESPEASALMHSTPDASISPPTPWFSPQHLRHAAPAKGKDTADEEREFTPATWTTAEIADGLELRQRGHDPRRLKQLMRLAKRLKNWLEEESEAT
jgi:DNA-binding transcriptional MerR regulator